MNKAIRPPPNISEETVRELIANQAMELRIREQQLVVDREAMDHNQKIATLSIQSEVSDRADSRKHDQTMQRNRFFLIAVALLCLATTIIWLASLGKDELVEEIVKAVLFAVTGAFGGFAYGRSASVHGKANPPIDEG